MLTPLSLSRRTKWKRQTAVGLELLTEAGNYAALQRLYGQHIWPSTPALTPLTPTLPTGEISALRGKRR